MSNETKLLKDNLTVFFDLKNNLWHSIVNPNLKVN